FKNSFPYIVNLVTLVKAGDKLDFYKIFNLRNVLYKAIINFINLTFLPLLVFIRPYNCPRD
ncbi:hypothetical protein V2W45_1247614, partial [Cenococcum geophilum]